CGKARGDALAFSVSGLGTRPKLRFQEHRRAAISMRGANVEVPPASLPSAVTEIIAGLKDAVENMRAE
ncbi:MAG: hypothetical protein WAK69_06370, partial [Rhodoplanes sp.]